MNGIEARVRTSTRCLHHHMHVWSYRQQRVRRLICSSHQQLRCASRLARAAVGISRSHHLLARILQEVIGPTNVISSPETLLADSLVVECQIYDVSGRRLALPSVLASVIEPHGSPTEMRIPCLFAGSFPAQKRYSSLIKLFAESQ